MISKILMYVLSHGCLLSSYKEFFNLHTWVCLSRVFTSRGCKCLFIVYDSCYESYLVSHDVSIYCMMELRTSLHVLILHPRHHSSWTDLPFLLGIFCTNDVVVFIILFFIFELSSLVLRNKSHSSLLVGDYVRDLSYKSNAFVWLEKFHKEYSYRQILMHKWSCNYFIQYNIHPYLTEPFYIPSISTRTTLRLCTNPICQQRGFILDK